MSHRAVTMHLTVGTVEKLRAMTAEIAILNRYGVALAADSAVSIGGVDQPKIYNTVNKLFSLSKVAPVGAMIFGNALLTGVPWENVVKSFRKDLGVTVFEQLAEYQMPLSRT